MPNIRVSEETLAMLRRVQGIFKAVSEDGSEPTYDEIIQELLRPIIDLWEGRMEVVEIPMMTWEEFLEQYKDLINQQRRTGSR